jgi:hypothetical protein
LSLFVHVTVLLTPRTTVMFCGLKEKFLMLTLTVLCAVAVGTESSANAPAETRTVRKTIDRTPVLDRGLSDRDFGKLMLVVSQSLLII